jgi:hypothetical protein
MMTQSCVFVLALTEVIVMGFPTVTTHLLIETLHCI